jgi:CBS domain containing-hemolysin-like protein
LATGFDNVGRIGLGMISIEFLVHGLLFVVLLCCSAFFSGAETAFFNLSRRQINQFQKSKHKVYQLVFRLLDEPKKLLSCLLFGNILVNVLFFAVASVFSVKIERKLGVTMAAVTGTVTFLILVLFGEIVPKSLSYTSSKAVSIAAAVPALVCVRLFSPVIYFFRFFIVEPAIKLILGPVRAAKPISASQFKSFIGQIKNRGQISSYENRLLSEIIEFGFLKVCDCLQPRVDMVSCGVSESREKVIELMVKKRLTKLPVYKNRIDNIVGIINFRDLLIQPEVPIEKLAKSVHFIPEQKKLESLLIFLRERRVDTAVVVDEYGGIAGMIRLEDIAEELLGPIEGADEIEAIEQIGPLTYRLSGALPIHDWSEAFAIEPVQSHLATIAGFVTALLGRIPKEGDIAYLNDLKFTIERVEKHRIKTLILTFQADKANDQ